MRFTELSQRTAVVGTALSVRQLCHCLGGVESPPEVVGCIVPDRAATAELPVPVLGLLDELETALRTAGVEQVLVCLPLAMADTRRRVEDRLDRVGLRHRFVPTLGDQLAGRIDADPRTRTAAPSLGVPEVDPAALLDRSSHPLDDRLIRQRLAGRRVAITGAGGSIGAELARSVCRFGPAELLLIERSENALFEIDRELGRVFPEIPRRAILHDVTQRQRTFELCGEHRPEVVFHAAAHKHVPMMEEHPSAALENNFVGTRAIADAAVACGAERFVMISTDKAVNPSSIMGASKRLAELYVQHLDRDSRTKLCMVRFGNVLGSACSVLPIWAQELRRGGPVSVTHRDMQRYFMTIPEAAGLVLQAGALSTGGEVLLLDMGEPIYIHDLAERFCRLHGFEPGVDVHIRITGPRPGEKLYEELAYAGEDMLPTDHASVRIWRTTPPTPARIQHITHTLDRLRDGDEDHPRPSPWQGVDRESVTRAIRALLPEMTPAIAAAG